MSYTLFYLKIDCTGRKNGGIIKTFTMSNTTRYTIAIALLMISGSIQGQKVGIETLQPDSTLSINNKVEIGGTHGDIVLTDDMGSITFPATEYPNSPMMHMFSAGYQNADRMVLAHSPAFTNYGIEYRDDVDEFHFIGNGQHAFSIGIGTENKRLALANASIHSSYTFNIESDADSRIINIKNDKNSSSLTYGVYSRVEGTGSGGKQAGRFASLGGSGLNVGVYATASGSSEGNTALLVAAAGANAKAAEFLIGDVVINDDLIIDDAVMIGTDVAASGYRLSVNGKIISEELRIQNSNDWPDFVFADDYDLMPLEKLELAIHRQHHLPGIPSASVMEKEGILIGDMQKLTMQKIEELTLYVIALNKENEVLKNEMEELKAVLDSITNE